MYGEVEFFKHQANKKGEKKPIFLMDIAITILPLAMCYTGLFFQINLNPNNLLENITEEEWAIF